ncbi:MAG: HAD-IB family hydrolase, partial [Actinomycetia bacterium]|nr:HAD-IB family hydrolase [Actinomycetes bacterium]
MKKAAFFDIDSTLIKGDAASYFGRHLLAKGIATPFIVMKLVYYTILFKIGRLNVREAMIKNSFFTGGHTVEKYNTEAQEAFDKYMKFKIYKETADRLEDLRKKGYLIVIASSGLCYIAEPLSDFLKSDFFIATEMEIKDGIVTGIPLEQIPYGEGKLDAIEALSEKEEIDLSESFFFSDSIVDLPVFEKLGNCVAVNPDKKLRKLALK